MARVVVVLDEVSVVDFDVVVSITVLRFLVLEAGFVEASDTVDRCVDSLVAPSFRIRARENALDLEVFDVVAKAVVLKRSGWRIELPIELFAAFPSISRCTLFLRASSLTKKPLEVCISEHDSPSEEDC